MPIPSLSRRVVLPALALGVLLLALPTQAQDASERVLRSWTDVITLENGAQELHTVTVTYNVDRGVYTRTVTNERGHVLDRTEQTGSLIRPTEEEIRQAREAILRHPEIVPLVDQALNPTLSGGFVLLREEGHPCGPGSRCLQFDLYDVNDAAREVDRIRYLVVDARDFTVIDTDFDPSTEGNATRFNR